MSKLGLWKRVGSSRHFFLPHPMIFSTTLSVCGRAKFGNATNGGSKRCDKCVELASWAVQ